MARTHIKKALFILKKNPPKGSVGSTAQVQGKALSYNNIADADAALETVKEFDGTPACVIVKHANPCGVAIESTLELAYLKAFSTDPTSAFGGVIAFNGKVNKKLALTITEKQFVEVIIAPEYEPEAIEVFAVKKNLRVLNCGYWKGHENPWTMYKRVNGGLLVQDADTLSLNDDQITVVSKKEPTEQQLARYEICMESSKTCEI